MLPLHAGEAVDDDAHKEVDREDVAAEHPRERKEGHRREVVTLGLRKQGPSTGWCGEGRIA